MLSHGLLRRVAASVFSCAKAFRELQRRAFAPGAAYAFERIELVKRHRGEAGLDDVDAAEALEGVVMSERQSGRVPLPSVPCSERRPGRMHLGPARKVPLAGGAGGAGGNSGLPVLKRIGLPAAMLRAFQSKTAAVAVAALVAAGACGPESSTEQLPAGEMSAVEEQGAGAGGGVGLRQEGAGEEPEPPQEGASGPQLPQGEGGNASAKFPERVVEGWQQCTREAECLELAVPLDPAGASDERLRLLLTRVRSRIEPPRGTLVVNPGGPGQLGALWLVTVAAGSLQQAFPEFDLVSFDPRGTGASGGLGCDIDLNSLEVYEREGVEGLISSFAAIGDACEGAAGAVFRKMGSHRVVDDLEAVRQALGGAPLNFLGISYGTRLGALYAQTYPESARAIILDAPVAPEADLTALAVAQFDAAIQEHQAFFEACRQGQVDCPEQPEAVFERLVAAAREAGTLRDVSQSWRSTLSLSGAPGRLASTLQAFLDDPESVVRPAAADPAAGGAQVVSLLDESANFTVHCTDSSVPPPSVAELEGLFTGFHARSPFFAATAFGPAACAGWPHTVEPAVIQSSQSSEVPLLLVGGERDTLAPFALAEQMLEALPGSALVSSPHYGHSAFSNGSECALSIMRSYLLNPQLPVPVACDP